MPRREERPPRLDAKYWLDRAEEARVIAQELKSKQAKKLMLAMAADYEKLAARAISPGSIARRKRPH
jgi:hypothetical protein